MTFGTWRWWGCQAHAPAVSTPRKCSWYSFSLGAESTPGSWYSRKEYVTEKPSDITGNRSRDRPTSSAAPEPLRHPRPQPLKDMKTKICCSAKLYIAVKRAGITRVQKIPHSNLDQKASYLDWIFWLFSSVPPDKFRNTTTNWVQAVSFNALSSSIFTNYIHWSTHL